MSATPIAIPTGKPGELLIPALGRTFQQVELREDDVYDTIAIPAGNITAGTEFEVFRDINQKFEQHTNLPQSRRIASGDEVAVYRVGVHPREAHGNVNPAFTTYRQVLANGLLDLKFNRRVISAGPLVKYPTGYGISGFSNETAAAGIASASIGVPSVAAAPTLFVPQQLKDDDDIICKIRFPDAQWLAQTAGGLGTYTVPVVGTGGLLLTVFLRGVIKSPLGK
jgi:hypothetical protein